jgi:hypothetical protein
MSTVQQRLAAVAETAANLKAQLRELDQLRAKVRKAQQSTQRSAPQRPQLHPRDGAVSLGKEEPAG